MYDIDFTTLSEAALLEPVLEHFPKSCLMGYPHQHVMDLTTLTVKQTEVEVSFKVNIFNNGLDATSP
jgi:hypothetical protein